MADAEDAAIVVDDDAAAAEAAEDDDEDELAGKLRDGITVEEEAEAEAEEAGVEPEEDAADADTAEVDCSGSDAEVVLDSADDDDPPGALTVVAMSAPADPAAGDTLTLTCALLRFAAIMSCRMRGMSSLCNRSLCIS